MSNTRVRLTDPEDGGAMPSEMSVTNLLFNMALTEDSKL